MEPRHQAIAAGLALTLAFGTVSAPTITYANTSAEQGASSDAAADGAADGSASGDGAASGTDTGDAADAVDDAVEELPEPGDYDRALDYEEAPTDGPSIMMLSISSLLSSRSISITPQALSSEMKYFAENESGSNYDQGFSYGDGYNAMGFYQFDRRYSLLDFMKACYSYNPSKYGMFKAVIDRGDELKTGTIYDRSTKKLTEIGQLAEDAWHAAYAADRNEFAALQDNFAYQEYYLPVERILKNSFGVDISGRADCVKGLAWGLCNLFGSGGCQKFFGYAKLSQDMTDEEFVIALCSAVIDNVDGYTYGASYRARYERELQTCLNYLAQHEDETPEDEVPEEDAPAGGTVETPGGAVDGSGNAGGSDGGTAGDDAGNGSDGNTSDGATDGGAHGGSASDDGADGGSANGSQPDADDGANGSDGSTGGDAAGNEMPDGSADGSTGGAAADGAEPDAGETPDADTETDGAVSAPSTPDADADEGDSASNDAAGDNADDDAASNDTATDGKPTGDATTGSANPGSDGADADADVTLQGDQTTGGGAPATGDESTADGSGAGEGTGADAGDQPASDQGGSAAGGGDQAVAPAGQKAAGNASGSGSASGASSQEKLPATADATGIAALVSAGLSTVGAGVVIAGKKMRGEQIPYEDGFRG